MEDNLHLFSGFDGVMTPEEIELLRAVYAEVRDRPWFTADPDLRNQFARYVIGMYRRGLVIPEKLRSFSMAAARAKFAEIDCADRPLKSRRVLVVEDNWDIADDMVRALADCGATVVGPASNVSDAMELLDLSLDHLDGALLDIRLGEERVFPIADRLQRSGIPFAFVTGYGDEVPSAYANVPRALKPLEAKTIAGLTSSLGPASF